MTSHFLNQDSLNAGLNSHCEAGMELQEKEEKDENHRGELFRKNPREKDVY